MSKRVIIIGNGIAGITAARFIRKFSDFHITVISSETKYFFARTALMYIYMGHMKFEHTKPYEDDFWIKNKINLIHDHVQTIDFKRKKVILGSEVEKEYDILVIATGSQSGKLGCEGEDLKGVTSLYSYPDLLRMEKLTRNISNAAVIGGGLVGIEMAEMLHSRNIDVTFLIREESYWRDVLPPEESQLISGHIQKRNINIIPSVLVNSFVGDNEGKLEAVILNNEKAAEIQFAGITIGVKPNVEFLIHTELEIQKGIKVNSHLETNIPDVYAIGDCAQLIEIPEGRKSIEAVWYSGRIMGETVAHTICGDKMKYSPGIWFNSAKFFDIEYQSYGYVPPNPEPDIEWFYWEDRNTEKAIRLVWEKNSGRFLGMNALGIRISHPVANKWITTHKSIGHVVRKLGDANFDPEFFKRYEPAIQEKFKADHSHLFHENILEQ